MSDWPIFRGVIDGFSVTAIVGVFVGALPTIAAVVALVWYLIQIYESKTFQNWYQKRRARRAARVQSLPKVPAITEDNSVL